MDLSRTAYVDLNLYYDRKEMRKRSESQAEKSMHPTLRPKSIGLGAVLGLLLIFAAVVTVVSFSVRSDIRKQLLSVDSHVLSLLVKNQISRAETEAQLVFEFETLSELEIWSALLETSSLEGVFALQYFGVEGDLNRSSSEALLEQPLSEEVIEVIKDGKPHSFFFPSMWLSEYVDLGFGPDRVVPVIEIYLPLRSSDALTALGTARFMMDGSVLADEFSLLDRRLLRQAAVAIGLGSVLMLGLFWMAWKRLSQANSRVLRQAERLKKVNNELALLARTSAVGSVTAHLIHGLKNPLAGLRQVVSARHSGEESGDDVDWKGAKEAADRMQRMVEEVIGVLQDESSGLSYKMNSQELLSELENRFRDDASRRSVTLSVSCDRGFELDSSVFNIALLVASNLVQNALDALEEGGCVTVSLEEHECTAVLRVWDDGRGIPESLRERLFTPVTSGKSGGAGIGLAISSQLARHLGGELQLLDTQDGGALFELRFPARE